jgi:two-component system, LytTR family, response regulator
MNTTIKCIIVDDEIHARSKIASLLSAHGNIQVIAEASHGAMAVSQILELKPDMVFLDIQMPKPDGFGVLREIPRKQMPYVIFITAFNEYAINAFEVHALDYLLKPFSEKRFNESVERAKQTIFSDRKAKIIDQIALLNDLDSGLTQGKYPSRLPIKVKEKIYLIDVSEIHSIAANGNYVSIQTDKSCYSVRNMISSLEIILDPSKFFRIHRSVLVNADKIQDLQHWIKGEYLITMPGNKRFSSSRKYRDNIEKLVKTEHS